MNSVDLHVHSNKSDGTLTPSGLVELAVAKGLTAFALTDHDTVDGIDEAVAASAGKPVEVIPGIEFSTEYEGKDIHIVGLFIEYNSPLFRSQIKAFVDSRVLRNQKMCERLRDAGADISYEKLLSRFPQAVITRAHYARYLLETGFVKSLPEAFERYIGDRCPCFVPREKVTPGQAVSLIRETNGLAVLAHPTLYHMSDARLEALALSLKDAGLDAIECIYSTYTAGEQRQMQALAKKLGLLPSGGSDFHGGAKPGLELGTGYGRLFVPEEILIRLKERRDNR